MDQTDERTDLLRRYHAARDRQRRLHGALLHRVGQPILFEAVDRLGISRDGDEMFFESDHEMLVAGDFAIYSLFREGLNAPQRVLAEDPPDDTGDRAALIAMAASWFSVFAITKTDPGVGLTLLDVFTGEPVSILDVGLSQAGAPGLVMSARLTDFGGLTMTTGAVLALDAEAMDEIALAVTARFGDRPTGELATLTAEDATDFAAIVTGVGLDFALAAEADDDDLDLLGFPDWLLPPDAPAPDTGRAKPKRGVAQLPPKSGKPRKPKRKPKKKR